MDALHIHEQNGFAPCLGVAGKMHACGHDGHTAMLLGAARYLAETRNFAGTRAFHLPAGRGERGRRPRHGRGRAVRQIPGRGGLWHAQLAGLAVGEFAVRPGPMLAACDLFEIAVEGKGAHAALPHLGIDPIICAAADRDRAADHHQPQHPSARQRRRQHHPDPWRRHLERDPRRGGAARHGALVQARAAGRDRGRDAPHRPRRRGMRWARASRSLRPALSRHGQQRGRDRDRRRRGRRRGRSRAGRARRAADHGRGGFRLHAEREARLLHLHRQWPARRRRAAQPALRFQRRDPADRRELLGELSSGCWRAEPLSRLLQQRAPQATPSAS